MKKQNHYFKTAIALIFGCLLIISCAKTEEKVPKELSLKDQILLILQKEFPEYTYIQHFIGNIDADAIEEDVVVVAERTCKDDEEKASEESKCRLTAFLKQQADKSYAVVASNNEVIGCSDCGGAGVGDPGIDIKISNGKVQFTSMYGASTKTIIEETFTYYSPAKKWRKTRYKTKWYRIDDTLPNGNIKNHVKVQTPKHFGEVYF
jgi:hypothetical protein